MDQHQRNPILFVGVGFLCFWRSFTYGYSVIGSLASFVSISQFEGGFNFCDFYLKYEMISTYNKVDSTKKGDLILMERKRYNTLSHNLAVHRDRSNLSAGDRGGSYTTL